MMAMARHSAEDALRAPVDRQIQQVKADMIGGAQAEAAAPEHQPQPGREANLDRPPHRDVEQVTGRDLHQEHDEDGSEQCRCHRVCEMAEPLEELRHAGLTSPAR